MAPKTKKTPERRGEELEREYVIPLRASMHQPSRRRRAGHALETVRRFVVRHMKGRSEDVWIDPRLNEHIWERGVQHIPSVRPGEGDPIRGRPDRGRPAYGRLDSPGRLLACRSVGFSMGEAPTSECTFG